jgi:glycosyltransferase involved in cell wall biosynthesis
MRIAVDTRFLYTARTGVRAYAEGLLPALERVGALHELRLLSPQHGPRTGATRIDKVLNHLATIGWTELLLPARVARLRCDVLLSLEYTSPLVTHCPCVVVFYDALFWADSTRYNRWWRLLQDTLTLPAARHAARVITISEYARQDIARHTRIPLERIVAIHLAAKPRASDHADAQADRAVLARYDLADRPYLLHLGVLEKRKNLPLLVRAFARCRQALGEPLQLVLAGQPGPKTDMDDTPAIRTAIEELGLGDAVRLTGFVSDADVPALYRGCRAFAFPSLQEGFGIPILEAFAYGVPVVAARATALPEVGGDAALYFEPTDADDLARCLQRVLVDDALRAQMIARGRERAELFTWDRTARGVLDILEAVVAERVAKGGHDA